MVELPFNLQGFIFQSGLDALEAGLKTTLTALANELNRIKEERVAYEEASTQGGEWIGECDDDGYVLWDQSRLLSMQAEAACTALMDAKKAFVIAVYHYWERSALNFIGKGLAGHENLENEVRKFCYQIDPKLKAVCWLVNTLKHNNERYGSKLRNVWPEVINSGIREAIHADWYGSIHLSDEQVFEVLAVIRNSGPTSSSAWNRQQHGSG